MLLVADIGNTNINFGLYKITEKENSLLLNTFSIPTQSYNLNKLKAKLANIDIKDSVLCSVVPEATGLLKNDLQNLSRGKPYIIGKDIIVPLKNLYLKPKEVGQDRLVNAYAASKLYKSPLIAIDFGTAITFDIISKKKEYLGGMILPGLRISLETLKEKTALLPKISIQKPKEFIGRDTKTSMLSGLIFGFASLTDEMITKIKKITGKKTMAIGTGGNLSLMAEYCHKINHAEKNLTLNGLVMLYFYKKNT